MGCGEAVEKLSPEEDSCTSIKEDCRVLAYRHVPPCGKGSTNPAGSGAPGLRTGPTPLRCHPRKALPAEAGGEGSGGRRRRILGGKGGLGPLWPPTVAVAALAWASTALRRQRAAAVAAGAAAPTVGGGRRGVRREERKERKEVQAGRKAWFRRG